MGQGSENIVSYSLRLMGKYEMNFRVGHSSCMSLKFWHGETSRTVYEAKKSSRVTCVMQVLSP